MNTCTTQKFFVNCTQLKNFIVEKLCKPCAAFPQVFCRPTFRAARFLLPYSNRLATIHFHRAALVEINSKSKANWNFFSAELQGVSWRIP